jgi:exopolysaccharide biosynthesis predicted pyruvyltransferase EpsI
VAGLKLDAGVADVFAALSGTEICYFPNPGNAGDALISAAILQQFKAFGISISVINHKSNVEGRTVILGGGGNFIPLYSAIRISFERFLNKAERIILLPHTIRGNDELIRSFDERCTIFCRDQVSYDHVRSLTVSADIRLADDMAFSLDVDEILCDEGLADVARPLLQAKLAESPQLIDALQSGKALKLFRTDRESTVHGRATDSDLSLLVSFGVKPEQARISSWCILEIVRQSKKVETDRLHIGISCALLGIPCELHDNSYGKNLEVFKKSIVGNFNFVNFIEQ